MNNTVIMDKNAVRRTVIRLSHEVLERNSDMRDVVLVGINDFMFRWTLAPGEEFDAPEAVMCYAPDEDGVSNEMHAFVGEHIVRGKWKKKERPVLVNNWEGTYFDFNEEKILDIARAAKKTGVKTIRDFSFPLSMLTGMICAVLLQFVL